VQTTTAWPYTVHCHEHVTIPMDDRVQLSARLWLPETDDPVPAILEYIPYRKRDFTARRDSFTHPYLAGHGYACLRVDLRGSGESEGVLEDEYLPRELDDAAEVLRWIARQPWCTGDVGMMGISWGGFNALQLAAFEPPQLKAIVACCASDDRYADDVHYMGGCLLGDNLSWASTMFAYNSCPPDPALVGPRWRAMWHQRLEGSGLWLKRWLEHQRRDLYWQHGSVCEHYANVKCPVLAVSGWADGYSNAVFRLLEHLRAPCLGLIGPWSHKYPHMGVPGPAIGFLQELLRWWDYWLKGIETGIMAEPALRVWMQHSTAPTPRHRYRPGRWVAEPTWPSPRVNDQTMQLTARGALHWQTDAQPPSNDEPAAPLTIQSPLSLGLFAGKWCSYAATPDLPHDQREEDGGALVFDSEPLSEPIEILGAPILRLELTSNKPIAMLAVRLSDIAPDDQATRITYGLLNLTHRESHAEPEPLVPHQRYRIAVQLNGVAQSFPVGHRLRVALSTSYWPLAWAPPEPVRLTIHAEHSSLVLPIREPWTGDRTLAPFGPPVGAPPIAKKQLTPTHHNWRVIRDLAADQSTLEVVRDEGTFRLEDIDLTITSKATERYRSTNNDFTSLSGQTRWVRAFKRGDWKVKTITHTELTASPANFYLRANLDAYEDQTRVFTRDWNLTIPRDHV
jgi:predicted acyl esterase